MDQETFRKNFREAAASALTFGRKFILEQLPDVMCFRVRLNQSYDGNPLHSDEKTYPEDRKYQRAYELRRCTESEVVATLWRDGAVPEWVNASVVAETGTETVLQLLCCGRFTANDKLLYHQKAGLPPFHVLGPVLPAGYKEGDRFSIWHRSELWSVDDLELLGPHIQKVWSLDLSGDTFDDTALSSLPAFPALEILELKHSPVQGDGLTIQNKHLRLRVLRVALVHPEGFCVRNPSSFPVLEVLSISNLPSGPCGIEELVRGMPRIASLTLESAGNISFDAPLPGPLRDVRIAARNASGEFRLPTDIGQLSLHLPESTPLEVDRIMRTVKKVRALFLGGTPVDDSLAEEIVSRLHPEFISLVGTKVSANGLSRLAKMYPDLRVAPKAWL